jgi:beta-glucosidase
VSAPFLPSPSRRRFLGAAAITAGAVWLPGADTPSTAAPTDAERAAAAERAAENVATARARGVVARMTLDEKIAQVSGTGMLGGDYAGSIPANPRLGIPALILGDGPDGVANRSTGATLWPCAAARAATWDVGLVREFGRAYGAEQAGKGRNVALAPTINILRRPNWGRAFETFTEDPFLNAGLAVAAVQGIQENSVIATVKHFAANNQEVQRGSVNAVVSRRALEEIYYPGFRAAVGDGGAGAVMAAYNKLNGAYCCESAALLTGTLHDEWGFSGFVVSDWLATHSTVASAKAGLDMEMPSGTFYGDALKAAVRGGAVAETTIDRMVTGILASMFRVGLFDRPTPDPAKVADAVVSTPAHRALALDLAAQGTVLLKNAGPLLPLDTGRVKRIAVIGDVASLHPQVGGQGSAAVIPSAPVVTPLAGITNRAGAGIEVTHTAGTAGTGPLPAIPSSAFLPSGGVGTGAGGGGGSSNGNGLTGVYFGTADFTGTPLGTRLDPNLDFVTAPDFALKATIWSAVWTGTLIAPTTGAYRFSVSGGGAIDLTIDGAPVVSFVTGYEAVYDGVTHLTAGHHDIKVTFSLQPTDVLGLRGADSVGVHIGWQPDQEQTIADAATAARNADVAIVFVADSVSEGMDRRTLALPADQDSLIEAVAAANPQTVVVLNTSAAVLMPWLDHVAGVVEAWYAGQIAGDAIAAVLFGDVNPSGRLPHTFPASDDQGPAKTPAQYPGDGTDVHYDEGIRVGYRWYDSSGEKPLFPFGFGLSYTSFSYSAPTVSVGRGADGITVDVTATVHNTGARPGAEVAQLYLSSPSAARQAPQQLKGFAKVQLSPGESRTVSFALDERALQSYDDASSAWRVFPGGYAVTIGGSSRDPAVRGSFTIGAFATGSG